MHFTTASTSGAVTLLPLLFSHSALSELLGCDAVGCPVGQYQNAQCEIGNATLKAIGIANVTTTLDTRPLTWTLGLQEINNQGGDQQPIFDRNFYLGTPPSLQLKNTTGCALFFEGTAANLTAPNGNKMENFTCSDALNWDCVSDLIAQAQSAVKDIVDETNDSEFCNRLRQSLIDKPPSTCNGVKGSWDTVIARALTGDAAPAYANQTQCHPTTGRDYDLSLVTSQREQPSSREWSQLAPVLEAITPVMTVFNKGSGAEVELTCLTLVEGKANLTTDGSSAGTSSDSQGSSAGLNSPFASFLALVAMALVLVF